MNRLGHGAIPDALFNLVRHLRMLLQVLGGAAPTLADAVLPVAVPGAGLFDDAELTADIQQFSRMKDALAVQNFELRLLERLLKS